MKEEVKKWMEQAKEDLKSAEYNFKGEKYDVAAFLSQQAAEKALKAAYIKKYFELAKVHDLVFLAKKLYLPEHIILLCDKLTRIYTETRYPTNNTIPARKFSKSRVKELINDAKQVLEWLKKMI